MAARTSRESKQNIGGRRGGQIIRRLTESHKKHTEHVDICCSSLLVLVHAHAQQANIMLDTSDWDIKTSITLQDKPDDRKGTI